MDLVNRHKLSCSRHAAKKYGYWIKIVKVFKLQHKPIGLNREGGSMIKIISFHSDL